MDVAEGEAAAEGQKSRPRWQVVGRTLDVHKDWPHRGQKQLLLLSLVRLALSQGSHRPVSRFPKPTYPS